jgi:hypothetical protein
MKRYLGSVIVAALILAWAAVPGAVARSGGMGWGVSSHYGGGWGGHGSWGGRGGWGGHGGYWQYGHGGYYGLYFGWPLAWYPYYGGPYYYDSYYPPPYAYDYYDGNYPAPTYSYGNTVPGYAYPNYDRRDSLTLGHDSGKALRLQKVSREWLVDYLRAYVINASPSVRDDFRRGFISGFGEGAESVLQKAMQDAGQPSPPPPPRDDSGPKSESTPPEKSP